MQIPVEFEQFSAMAANKHLDLYLLWLETVERCIVRDAEPKRGAKKCVLSIKNTKCALLRADSPESRTRVPRSRALSTSRAFRSPTFPRPLRHQQRG